MKTLTILLCLSSSVIGGGSYSGDQRIDRFDDQHIKSINEELLQNHRRTLDVKVDVCLDATKYFGWSDGNNFLRLYHECICSGDLNKDFRMECTMKNYCFSDDNGVNEMCITRMNIYDFHVDPETGLLKELRGIVTSDIYESGFPFSGNFTSVSSTACIQEVRSSFPDFGMGQVMEVCNEHCPAFLEKNQYSQERIAELCPVTLLDGVQCNSHGRNSCRKMHERRKVNATLSSPMIYLSTPDCSNVYPCLASSCQGYPQIDTAPERRLFRYPKCGIAGDNGDKTVVIPGDDNGNVLGGPSNVVKQSAACGSPFLIPLFVGAIGLFCL